jgi:putative hydrolase
VAEIRNVRKTSPLEIVSGVEANLLNAEGDLDAPANLDGIDRIYAAAGEWPLAGHSLAATMLVHSITQGKITLEGALSNLIDGYHEALDKYSSLVLTRPFSILRKCRLDESAIPTRALIELARHARAQDAWLEVGERSRCPSAAMLALFAEEGVTIVAGTNCRVKHGIAKYDYVRRSVWDLLRSQVDDIPAGNGEASFKFGAKASL